MYLYTFYKTANNKIGGKYMEKDKQEANILDELNKGACMGKDTIEYVISKVEDKKLKKVLNDQYKKYKCIGEKIEDIYPKYCSKEVHKTNSVNKVLTWYGIEVKTFLDKSTSKITELLLQGTNMGIIEGRKILNNKDMNKEIHKICQEYVDMQEEAIEKLKQFL